jgi:hypothetical protein
MKWDYKENILFKENLEFKKFKKIIEKIIQIDNDIIILFESEKESNSNNNVTCLMENGEVKWIIDYHKYPNKFCPVTNIYKNGDFLYVYRRCGIEEKVDINSGQILESELIK